MYYCEIPGLQSCFPNLDKDVALKVLIYSRNEVPGEKSTKVKIPDSTRKMLSCGGSGVWLDTAQLQQRSRLYQPSRYLLFLDAESLAQNNGYKTKTNPNVHGWVCHVSSMQSHGNLTFSSFEFWAKDTYNWRSYLGSPPLCLSHYLAALPLVLASSSCVDFVLPPPPPCLFFHYYYYWPALTYSIIRFGFIYYSRELSACSIKDTAKW